jgi:Tfp pilus assembly protein PilX
MFRPTRCRHIKPGSTRHRYLRAGYRREKGMALFTTLLLLALVSLLGLAMALTVNSDMMINGFYGNYRGSFYAADAGLTIARQAIMNQLSASVNTNSCTGWGTGAASGCTTDPLSGTNASTVLSGVKTTYASFASINSGSSANSWPASFAMVDNGTVCTNSLAAATGSPTTHVNAGSGLVDSYTYTFNYTICSTGRAQSLQQVLVKETGALMMTVAAQTTTTQTAQVSFASFGVFIDNFSGCKGPLVPGTMTGPMFTNGAWNFGDSGSYIFTDPVSQANANASYWINGNCYQSSTTSYSKNGTTIKPNFQQGFNLNQPPVSLPANDFSQKWAVLDGKGCGEGGSTCGSGAPPAPTSSDMAAVLKDVKGKAFGQSGAASVFIPYCTGGASCPSPNTVTGGGIYVNGNASITLSVGNDTSTAKNPIQIYTITTGSTTTTITTNIAANTTIMQSGSNTVTLTGVPQNLTGATPQPGTMMYVNGDITGLTGPGQGKPGVQDYSQITIAANGNIAITGDLIYAHEPVTLNTSDTLLPSNDFNQVLGIFTANGNISLDSPYSNNNLETDASLAALNSSCTASSSSSICGFSTPNGINTWTIVGGRIESNAHSVKINQGNTYFDRRFTSKKGFAPPWFPSTSLPIVDITSALPPQVTTLQPQRYSWVTYPQ